MKLFDTHCHLDDEVYKKDIENCIDRCLENSVEFLMSVGVNEKTSFMAEKLSQKYDAVYAAIGVHPHNAKECNEKTIETLKELSKKPKVVAIGEIGLDFNRMFSTQDVQEKWFKKQIQMADELNLPIIFHERDSKSRFLEILKERTKSTRKGVVHCFSGSLDEMTEYLKLGLHIGITGILTLKERGKNLREIVKKIPINRLLIETDAPYLTPAPQKNKTRRNEPAFLKSIFLKLAEVLEMPKEKLAEQLLKNSNELFLFYP